MEFNGKAYKTLTGVVKAINTAMRNLEVLIDVKYKKVDTDSEVVRKEKKEKRKLFIEEFNRLIDEKYKYEEQKEIFDINKEKKKLQNVKNKKALGNLPATENAMFQNAKVKNNIRIQNRINREETINNNYGVNANDIDKNARYHRRQMIDIMALGGNFKEIYLNNNLPEKVKLNDAEKIVLDDVGSKLRNDIHYKIMQEYINNIKINNIRCHLRFAYTTRKWDDENNEYIIHKNVFNSKTELIKTQNNINAFIAESFIDLDVDLDKAHNGSGYEFVGITQVAIGVSRVKKIEAGAYIPTPKEIASKLAVVNFKNMNDDMCLNYCIIGSRYYSKINNKDKNNICYYKKYMSELKIPENQTYPIDIMNDIPLYEKLNNIKINVWKYEDGSLIELYCDKTERAFEVINLLCIIGAENKNHFVWIKDLSRMFASKTTGHKKYMCEQCLGFTSKTQEGLDHHLKHICMKKQLCQITLPTNEEVIIYKCSRCASSHFKTMEKLEEHLKLCSKYDACAVQLPTTAKNITKFQNFHREFKHPYHVFADFESTLEKVNVLNDINSETKKYQKHIQNSFGLKYNCIHEEHSENIKICNDKNPLEVNRQFIEELEKLALKSYQLTQLNRYEINYKENEEALHKLNKNCFNCKCEYTKDNKKVAHHDHISGEFISSLCNKCNLDFQYKKFLPVYIHNLKGYDAHLFITSLNNYGYKHTKNDNISCIPNNEEQYISFSKNIKVDEYINDKDKTVNVMFEIRFIDTYGFMASSLTGLIDNLKKGGKNIAEWRKIFKNVSNEFKDDEQFVLMIQKGIYPYDYIDNYEKLLESKLPKKKDFNNKLTFSKCSDEDYKQAQLVWKTLKCYTFMDYHNIYLKSDVLLLADVWESFREVCFTNYKLDADYYYTAPSLSWDAMLKLTGVNLELITDIDMYLFIESGIRGGMSQISKRYAKANNKEMTEFDETKELSNITYLDANNLYGWAMCEYLPQKDFKWNLENWEKSKIMELDNRGAKGYLFSVDLHIPDELHNHFNGYALAPESQCVLKENLNEWQQEGYKQSKIKKLITSLSDKKNYVLNYRILKLYLSLGVELMKVNQCVEYTQEKFMEPYIMLNTKLRTDAKNDFEKDFFKLMNNSCFGKTMENVRNRIDFRLISTEKEAWAVKNLKKFTIFNENLVGVHIQKTKVELNKPIYMGQCILDDSKLLMYDFHYNFMLKNFKRENIDLLFTDTDSLCYHTRNEDINEIIKNNKDKFDLSNYPKEHPLYDKTNMKVIGKFKNESPKQIKEFVGLRSKLYSYIVEDEAHEHLKCKGVKKSASDKQLCFNDYKNTLFNRTNKNITQNSIRSYKHQLYSISQTKTGISYNDDKVYVCDNNIDTITFGHYKNRK